MVYYFIGLEIVTDTDLYSLLDYEFNNSAVSYRQLSEKSWILYYRDRILEADRLTHRNGGKIRLTEAEMQHFINTLKRVRSDLLYNFYPDNLGLQKIGCQPQKPAKKTKLVIKRKI